MLGIDSNMLLLKQSVLFQNIFCGSICNGRWCAGIFTGACTWAGLSPGISIVFYYFACDCYLREELFLLRFSIRGPQQHPFDAVSHQSLLVTALSLLPPLLITIVTIITSITLLSLLPLGSLAPLGIFNRLVFLSHYFHKVCYLNVGSFILFYLDIQFSLGSLSEHSNDQRTQTSLLISRGDPIDR